MEDVLEGVLSIPHGEENDESDWVEIGILSAGGRVGIDIGHSRIIQVGWVDFRDIDRGRRRP